MLVIYWSCFIFGGIFVALSAIGGLDDIDAEVDVDTDTAMDGDYDGASFELEALDELETFDELEELGELGNLDDLGELAEHLGDSEENLTSSLDADTDIDSAFDAELNEPLVYEPQAEETRSLLLQVFQFLVDLFKSFKFWTFSLCFFGATGVALSLLNISPELIFPCAILVGLVLGIFMAGILRLLYNRSVNSLLETSELIGAIGTVELPFDASSRGRVRFNINGMLLDYTAYTDDPQGLELGQAVLAVNCDNNKLWVVATDDASF
jgi:membrane protein implicated in regulation of membrane protease activity